MTGSQYNNIIRVTLAGIALKQSSADAVRMVLKNCGVAFPHGSQKEVFAILASEDYMGWRSCTARHALEYANAGYGVVGLDTEQSVVILPEESAT